MKVRIVILIMVLLALLVFTSEQFFERKPEFPHMLPLENPPVISLDPKEEVTAPVNYQKIEVTEASEKEFHLAFDPPKNPEPPTVIDNKEKKLGYSYGLQDATESGGNVRATTAKVGLDFKVTPRTSLGVEAARKIHDSQDAAAWGETVEDENSAEVKYKLSF